MLPLSGQPRLINFFKPILFMASDSSSGYHRGISHFFTATKNTTEGTIWTWVSSKRKKGSFVTILCSFSCICRLSWVCILRETSTKATRKANCVPSLPPGLPCRLLSLGSSFNWLLSLLSDLPLFVHFRSRGRSRAHALCLGFEPKQRDRLPGTHTHIVSHCGQ